MGDNQRVLMTPRRAAAGRGGLTVLLVASSVVVAVLAPHPPTASASDSVAAPAAIASTSRTQIASPDDTFARVYIPALGDQAWGVPVVPGVRSAQLDKGFGSYPFAVKPGQGGNFAIAGHRTTHLAPLLTVQNLRPGDRVLVHYRGQWFTYRLQATKIVRPTAGWVVDNTPAPFAGATEGTVPYLTMTTCHPPGTARLRWVWWGALSSIRPDVDPPAVIERRGT